MATTSKTLGIKYTADTADVKKGVGEIERLNAGLGDKLKSAGRSMTNVGKTATLGLTLPLVAFGKTALDSFGEAQRVAGQTDAVLKSTGGAAGVTAAEIGKLSDKIGGLAAVDNDAVQAGANMLLTFTNIRNEAGKGNDVFNQSLMTLQDMASAMGTDTKSSAIQLGKALNDPVAGVSALSRVGVTFTEQQKKQIAAMVKAGDTAGAQKLILAELNKEFGGSAKAAGDAATPMQKIALQMDDLGEAAGAVLAPMLETVVGWVTKLADWFNKLSPGAKDIAVKIAVVAAAIGPLLIIGGKLVSAIGAISNAFKVLGLANPWTAIIAGVVLLAVLVIKNWDKIKGFVMPVLDAIKRFALAVWNAIKGAAEVVWNTIKAVVVGVWNAIKVVAAAYLAVWKAVFKVVAAVAKVVWNAIKAVVSTVWNAIKAIAKAYVAVWRAIFKVVAAVAKAVWKAIVAVVKAAWKAISAIGKLLLAGFKVVWNAIKAVASGVWKAIVGAVKIAWNALKVIGRTIKGFFVGIWNDVKGAAKTVWDAIKTTIRNVWDGIETIVAAGVNSIIWVLNKIIDGVNLLIRGVNLVKPGEDISSIDHIPELARGGRIMRAGLALVGENGPELVTLNRGAQVAPLNGAGGTGPIVLNLDRRRFGRGLELETLTRGR